MYVDENFLTQFINNVISYRNRLVAGDQKLAYLIDYYNHHNRPLMVCRRSLPIDSGPNIAWIPERYVIVTTSSNPYTAFKQACLGAVIVASGKNAILEYAKYANNLDILFANAPLVKKYYDELLNAFLAYS